MDYRTIAVIVTDETADVAALNAAAQLAARDGAHLDVHCLGIDPVRYDAVPMGATAVVLTSGADEARERAEGLVQWAEAELGKYDLSSVVLPAVANTLGLDTTVSRLAQYADLVVAAQPYSKSTTQLQVLTLEAALFGTGAPVLVVPEGTPDLDQPFKKALVAWNESEESLEAVRKAMPILQEAVQTNIVMVDPPSHSPERSDPGGNICMMLSHHGIRPEVSILSRTLPRVSEVLNRFAHEHGCDVIVMGAYGHSRFREAVLGGVTREMLESARIPVLMAH